MEWQQLCSNHDSHLAGEDAIPLLFEVLPELLDVPGFRITASHADNGNFPIESGVVNFVMDLLVTLPARPR